MKTIISVLVLILITSCMIYGCGGSDELTPITNNPVNTDLALFSYTGTGTDITPGFDWPGGAIVFEITYTGESNFIVHLRNSSSGEVTELLVNKIGDFTGTIPGNLIKGEYFLGVESSGEWTIKINAGVE